MARAMKTQPSSSILYNLISFDRPAVNVGLVQEGRGIARMTEHSTAASDTNPAELKYKGMRAAGGAAAWHFVPVMGGASVTVRQLHALEDTETGPNSWNDAGKTRKKKLKPTRPHREKNAYSAARVVRFESYTLQDGLKDGLTLETDPDLLVQAPKFILHSSRAALPTATTCKYGTSLTTATALLSSDSFIGSIRSTMKWASTLNDTWAIFSVLKRRTRRHWRTSYYKAMVAIALTVCHNLDNTYQTLSVYNLYALHWTSRQVCTPGVHLRNMSVIDKELW